MKKIVFAVFISLILFFQLSHVAAQDEAIPEAANKIKLTPSGSPFPNGSSSGNCTVAGGSCTLGSNGAGICVDNGQGYGVCTPATPTIDPLFDFGCTPDDQCHVPPEKLSGDLKGDQTEKRTYGQDPTGSTIEYQHDYSGEEKPGGAYGWGRELLDLMSKQSFDAAQDLTPAGIQDLTVHDTQPKRFCTTARLCIYNPWSHELLYNWVTDETWCTEDLPYRKEGIEGMRFLASFSTAYVLPIFSIPLPDLVVKKIAALGCGATLDDGKIMDVQGRPFIKRNYWPDGIAKWTVDIVEELVTLIMKTVELANGKTKEIPQWLVAIPDFAKMKLSSENPAAGSLAGITYTVTEQDLKPFGYPAPENKKLLTRGGFADTYRPDAFPEDFQTPLHAINETQQWQTDIAGFKDQESPSLQAMNARQEEAQRYYNCTILSDGEQKSQQFAALDCQNQHWGAGTKVQAAPIAPANQPAVPPGTTAASGSQSTTSAPTGLTIKPPGACSVGTCSGQKMNELLHWYQTHAGWWNNNDVHSRFTAADLLGIVLRGEANGNNTEVLKAITQAATNQLWMSGGRTPYCTSSDCQGGAGILNFLAAYTESAWTRYNGLISGNTDALGDMGNTGLTLEQIRNAVNNPDPSAKVWNLNAPFHWGVIGGDPNINSNKAKTAKIGTGINDVYYKSGNSNTDEVIYTLNQMSVLQK